MLPRRPRRFDLYADTRSQVYGGISAETAATDAAISATAGRALVWRGRPATTFYHSSSGGRTAAVADGLPGARTVPYLRSVRDPYGRASLVTVGAVASAQVNSPRSPG